MQTAKLGAVVKKRMNRDSKNKNKYWKGQFFYPSFYTQK
jgi:hypothetical protein